MATDRPRERVWRFASFEFDERLRELRYEGRAIVLEAKPLDVLRELLLHAGEVVTKDELLEAVWPGVSVADSSLATAVSKLRRALGAHENLVVTVSRIGYRLAGPVQERPAEQPQWHDEGLSEGDRVPAREQWHLTRCLGSSPSSNVWLAEHEKTREPRVFKFSNGDQLTQLKREVTVARLLKDALGESPAFVRVLEWSFDSRPYFVESEYAGPTVVDWAAQSGGLTAIPLARRVALLADVARAVDAAHSVDVLHKDLKPANILVAPTPDGTPQVKVADFGHASLLDAARLQMLGITNLGFSQTGELQRELAGTVIYVAPELLAGELPTRRSDVYALGVLLYQLIVGDFRKPLAPGWEHDVADSLLRADIAEAAAGDPARRIQTAGELARRLADWGRRRGGVAGDAPARLVPSTRRAGAKLWFAALVAIALAAVVAATTLGVLRREAVAALRSIAVVPLRNAGGDSTADYLRLALTDEVITILSHAPAISVLPLGTTAKYDGATTDLVQVARDLHVGTIVSGYFTRNRDRLRVSLEATDTNSGRVVWRDQMDGPPDSLIATDLQLSLRLKKGLLHALGTGDGDSTAVPANEEAYDLFLRSIAIAADPGPNAAAIAMLEKSVALASFPADLALLHTHHHIVETDPLVPIARAAPDRRFLR